MYISYIFDHILSTHDAMSVTGWLKRLGVIQNNIILSQAHLEVPARYNNNYVYNRLRPASIVCRIQQATPNRPR
jgi:hypothetical protein